MLRLLCGWFLFNFFAVVLGRITNDVFHMQRFYYYNKQKINVQMSLNVQMFFFHSETEKNFGIYCDTIT